MGGCLKLRGEHGDLATVVWPNVSCPSGETACSAFSILLLGEQRLRMKLSACQEAP